MTAYSRERDNGVPTRFIDVSEHPRIKRIALGIDVQDGQTAITVNGYTAEGETVVLENVVVSINEHAVENDLGETVWHAWAEITDDSEPERYVRHRQAARDRLAKAKLAQQAYDLAVRSGERAPCADTRHALRMATLEAETSVLQAKLAR